MFHLGNKNHYLLYSIVVFLVCYILLALIAMRPVFALDSYWHLQMGKDFVEKGLSPWVDHYSFSYPGKEISTVPVIFQVLLYQFVSLFGEGQGFYLIRLFYLSLLMICLFAYFRQIKASGFIVFLFLPLISYFIHIRLMVRPEIFSYVLMVLSLMLYLKAQKRFATKELLYICLLLLFWVNYHSPVIGYIIVFGLFLDKAINKLYYVDDSFSWKQWFIWGVVIFLIGFAKPGGQHFIITVINLMIDDFGKYTQEYADSYEIYSRNIVVNITWMLSVYVVVWSIIKKQFGFAFIAVVFTYFSLSIMRMITATTLINLCVLALYFSQSAFSYQVGNIRSSVKKLLLLVSVSVAIFAYYTVINESISSLEKNRNAQASLEKSYPVQVSDYLKRYHEGGNILNVMSTGGYLISKLSPEYKIYFDGRTNILYPIDFVVHNVGLLSNSVALKETVEKNNVNYALFENTVDNYIALKNTGSLELNFADENYILFSEKQELSFPLSSKLLVFPSCWKEDWGAGIEKEILSADRLLHGSRYSLKYVLDILSVYLSSEDKEKFFTSLQSDELHSDGVRRLAFILAWRSGYSEVASYLFSSIKVKSEDDVVLHAYYLAKNEQYRFAENILHNFYVVTKYVLKKNVSFRIIDMMTRTLKILEDEDKLLKFDYSYRGELEEKLKKANYSKSVVLSFDDICD